MRLAPAITGCCLDLLVPPDPGRVSTPTDVDPDGDHEAVADGKGAACVGELRKMGC